MKFHKKGKKMNKKLLQAAAIFTFTLGAFSIVTTSMTSTVSAAEATSSKLSWAEFRAQFNKAFDEGDTAKMEQLKSQTGFANINDLGGRFMKYGSGMGKWTQLISDAKKNAKK